MTGTCFWPVRPKNPKNRQDIPWETTHPQPFSKERGGRSQWAKWFGDIHHKTTVAVAPLTFKTEKELCLLGTLYFSKIFIWRSKEKKARDCGKPVPSFACSLPSSFLRHKRDLSGQRFVIHARDGLIEAPSQRGKRRSTVSASNSSSIKRASERAGKLKACMA